MSEAVRRLSDELDELPSGPAVAGTETPPPLLRGWLHLVCFFLAVPAGALVIARAGSAPARVGAVIYAGAVCALFGVSATYHRRRWSAAARIRMRRVDHATIFVMIAGSYTPLCLTVLRDSMGPVMLLAAWTGAALGVALATAGVAEKPVLGLACYIGLGWILILALPELARRLSATELALLLVGGVLYTAGAVFLGTKWPDPFPAIFGYHEVWHLMVVAACVCHYITIFSVVGARA